MNSSEFQDTLKKQLAVLPRQRVIEFALDICQRLLPDYLLFYHKRKWGDLSILQQAINFCEQNKTEQTFDEIKAHELLTDIVKAIPDTDHFGEWDGSYALNAAASVADLMEYLCDRDLKHILAISSYMTDTIDFKIHEKESNISTQQLEVHPLNLAERHLQIRLTADT